MSASPIASTRWRAVVLALCLLAVGAEAGAQDPHAGVEPLKPPGHPAIPSHGSGAPMGGGHPPIPSMGAPSPSLAAEAPAPDAEGRLHTRGVSFVLPKGWKSQPPSSAMRLAQVEIPGEKGAGQLVVFHFGAGQGGGVEDNVQRWVAQMQPAPGSPPPKRDSFDVPGSGGAALKVSTVEVGGTILPSTMGTGPKEAQPSSRLMGAVVEGPGGPWFLKATGPDVTLGAQRDAFVALLESLRAD